MTNDFSKRLESVKKNSKRTHVATPFSTPTAPPKMPPNEQVCPFMSSSSGFVACSARCKLYRQAKSGLFVCPFQELPRISWNINLFSIDKNNNQRNY